MPRKPKPKPAHRPPRAGKAAPVVLSIRLTDAEARQLRSAAGARTLSVWARETLLETTTSCCPCGK